MGYLIAMLILGVGNVQVESWWNYLIYLGIRFIGGLPQGVVGGHVLAGGRLQWAWQLRKNPFFAGLINDAGGNCQKPEKNHFF